MVRMNPFLGVCSDILDIETVTDFSGLSQLNTSVKVANGTYSLCLCMYLALKENCRQGSPFFSRASLYYQTSKK